MFAPFAASLLEVSDSSFTSLAHYSFSNAAGCKPVSRNEHALLASETLSKAFFKVIKDSLVEDSKNQQN
jgi:hypothetical protein